MERAKYRELYKNRDFLKLWISQFLCQLADRIFTYIIMINAFKLTHTNLGTSLPPFSYGLSAILFSLAFGVLVDRWKKKYILFSSNILRAILVLIIGSMAGFNSSMYMLFGVSFVVFTIAQIFIPAELAAIPQIVEKKELILANSLFMGTWMASSVLGFGLAVPLTFTFGMQITYYSITALYVLAALSIAILKKKEILHKKSTSFKTIRREFRSGLRFVLKHRVVFYSIFQMMFGISLLACMSVLAVGFTKSVLKLPETDFGYLVSISGVGMGIGIALISRLVKHFTKQQIITSGFLIISFAMFSLGSTIELLPALIMVLIMGFGNAFVVAPIQTIIHERTPSLIHGKVFSVQNMISALAFTLPPVIAGYFADIYGYKNIFAILGIISAVVTLTTNKIKK